MADQKKATVGFILSLIGGIIILVGAIAVLALGSAFSSTGVVGAAELGSLFVVSGAVGLISGILVIVSSILIHKPGKETIGGILAIVFSLVSIIGGGGFFIGLILALVGGILGLVKK